MVYNHGLCVPNRGKLHRSLGIIQLRVSAISKKLVISAMLLLGVNTITESSVVIRTAKCECIVIVPV